MIFEIADMIEYHLMLPMGTKCLPVPFTGGGVYGYGVRPATFATDDPALIRLIQNSLPYKTGKIKIQK